MPWQQISVVTSENSVPALSDFFSTLGAVSVTFMDAEDQPVYEPLPGETKIWRQTRVIALFEADANLSQVKSFVSAQFAQSLLTNWLQEVLQDQVWERAWMEYYQPMKFGNKLWVCPTGQERHEHETICLILDPGLAFGTGTHPTTALCLEWLASHDLNGKTIIDYGCGSGILAVAAILLGAHQAHAIDIDPQALTATEDNAKKNAVQDQIHTWLPEQFANIQGDIVLANILAKPLIDLSVLLTDLVKPGGQLVLSGILTEQTESVATAYRQLIPISPPVVREDWCRLDGFKPETAIRSGDSIISSLLTN